MQIRKRYKLEQSSLYRLHSRKKLAELIGLSRKSLDQLTSRTENYSERDSETRPGKIRHIEDPKPALKRVQRKLATVLSRIEPPDFLFCPVKGRSYVSNAAKHVDAAELNTLDLKSFFPSTPSRRVFWFFHKRMQCSEDVAGALTALATYSGHLPTGSPLSPIMAFYAYYDMWEKVSDIAKEAGCLITVYIDDLTLSGKRVPEKVFWQIKKCIHGYGLRYHKEKKFRGHYKEVTGVGIVGGRLVLPNRQHKKIHELRLEIEAVNDPEKLMILKRSLKGRETQARQVSKKTNSIS